MSHFFHMFKVEFFWSG